MHFVHGVSNPYPYEMEKVSDWNVCGATWLIVALSYVCMLGIVAR